MTLPHLLYDEPLYRPPSEARSLIFQVTLGCSWNRCAFCEMYSSKRFVSRPIDQVLSEIEQYKSQGSHVRRIFLADGNALVLSFSRLKTIFEALNNVFPQINRISSYALPADIVAKSSDELSELSQLGLKLLYIGIESGDDEVLSLIDKGETFESSKEALLKCRAAGIKTSVMILNGLGGADYSRQHAIHSARILNATQPEFASVLVLSHPKGEASFLKKFRGKYVSMLLPDLLEELKIFLEHTQLDRTVFRSDHISNYLILKGTLSKDKEKILEQIYRAQKNPHIAKNIRELPFL